MQQQRMNVREQIILTDTVLVGKHVGRLSNRPQGWFSTFSDLGNAGECSFMNVRNRSIGVMYNNQDARDQLPFGMRIMSIGVKFWAPSVSTFTACLNKGSTDTDREPYSDETTANPTYAQLTNREELLSGMWEADIPNHCSMIMRTNQDIRLRAPVAMLTPGYGAVGGGWGWGSPGDLSVRALGGTPGPSISNEALPPAFGGYATNLETVQHGVADIRQRFDFPIPIDVPKRANLSITIKLSQYAKELLKAISGPYWFPVADEITVDGLQKTIKSVCFGMQVTLKGERLVQQRGDYSV